MLIVACLVMANVELMILDRISHALTPMSIAVQEANEQNKRWSDPFQHPCTSLRLSAPHLGIAHWRGRLRGSIDYSTHALLQHFYKGCCDGTHGGPKIESSHNIHQLHLMSSGTIFYTRNCSEHWGATALTHPAREIVARVNGALHRILKTLQKSGKHTSSANDASDATINFNVALFERVAAFVSSSGGRYAEQPRYLEIGSNKGLSMAIFGSLLRGGAHLVSLDPYNGSLKYDNQNSAIGSTDMRIASEVYKEMSLTVQHIRLTSSRGLLQLLSERQQFDVIYIDALHTSTTPMHDLILALPLLSDGGVIMLDDWSWVSVHPVKTLCDSLFRLVIETPQIAAYQVLKSAASGRHQQEHMLHLRSQYPEYFTRAR